MNPIPGVVLTIAEAAALLAWIGTTPLPQSAAAYTLIRAALDKLRSANAR